MYWNCTPRLPRGRCRDSSMSTTSGHEDQSSKLGGPAITYPPSSHLPRSASWHRAEQKGNVVVSPSTAFTVDVATTGFSQVGQDVLFISLFAFETIVTALLNEVGTTDTKLLSELALIPMGANKTLVNHFGLHALDHLA